MCNIKLRVRIWVDKLWKGNFSRVISAQYASEAGWSILCWAKMLHLPNKCCTPQLTTSQKHEFSNVIFVLKLKLFGTFCSELFLFSTPFFFYSQSILFLFCFVLNVLTEWHSAQCVMRKVPDPVKGQLAKSLFTINPQSRMIWCFPIYHQCRNYSPDISTGRSVLWPFVPFLFALCSRAE